MANIGDPLEHVVIVPLKNPIPETQEPLAPPIPLPTPGTQTPHSPSGPNREKPELEPAK
jgi:hypothetical protein